MQFFHKLAVSLLSNLILYNLSTISMLLLACRELVGRKYSKTVSLSLVLVGTTLPQIQ